MSAYTQFSYPYPTPSQLLVSGQTGSAGVNPATSCCDNGRPIMTDPVSGQTVCSCQYAALGSYTRFSTASMGGVYGTTYPSTDQNPYPSIGVDSSAFYSPLSASYGLKEGAASADVPVYAAPGYYSYDPALAAYGYGTGYDLAARRKNATRESTATLKAWLSEHKKNPYPTKGEKIMLAIITKMTLTQVSTWFANARRRLKKENKMTWEPKNKTDDDDDDDNDFDDKDDDEKPKKEDDSEREEEKENRDLNKDDPQDFSPELRLNGTDDLIEIKKEILPRGSLDAMSQDQTDVSPKLDCSVTSHQPKPKIWSLADTAVCKTPPPATQRHGAPGSWLNNNTSLTTFPLPPTIPPSGNYSRYSGLLSSGTYPPAPAVHNSAYPEVQTDTPPQTPPNMKVANVSCGHYLSQPPSSLLTTVSSRLHCLPDRRDVLPSSQTPGDATAFRPVYRSSPPAGSFPAPV